MEHAASYWAYAESEAQRTCASGYDAAGSTIARLAEAHASFDRHQEFRVRLDDFLSRHEHRPALMRRLERAGVL